MYDCIVVGGGIAGLQGSIQLGRYGHRVLVIDKGRGRSTLCRSYHNILGWPDGIPGMELRRLGRLQAERLGVQFLTGEVIAAARRDDGFEVALANSGGTMPARTLLASTGIMDRYPPLPGLEACLGLSVFVCPDCDGYEVSGKRTIVLGSGAAGADMALVLSYWTDRIVYINHERKAIGSARLGQLQERRIDYEEAAVAEVLHTTDSGFSGVRLTDGRTVEGERGFIAFGGNAVHSDWLSALGVERLENKHIVTDPRSKQTSVSGIWAAGDVGVHAEQVTIAMGEGAQAAIWIHKELLGRKATEPVKA